jgi:hypothetical protein
VIYVWIIKWKEVLKMPDQIEYKEAQKRLDRAWKEYCNALIEIDGARAKVKRYYKGGDRAKIDVARAEVKRAQKRLDRADIELDRDWEAENIARKEYYNIQVFIKKKRLDNRVKVIYVWIIKWKEVSKMGDKKTRRDKAWEKYKEAKQEWYRVKWEIKKQGGVCYDTRESWGARVWKGSAKVCWGVEKVYWGGARVC